MILRLLAFTAALFAFRPSPALSASIVIPASLDNTMYEHPTLNFSNGAGEYLFAGRTGDNANFAVRRALISFDVAAAVPAGATIESVTLKLNLSRLSGVVPTVQIQLHAVLAAWGEGSSDAQAPGGGGFPSQPGDASWFYRNYNVDLWTNPGGDFSPVISAQTAVQGVGFYNFSGSQMVADVQSWLANPAGNFGWVLLGDEVTDMAARRFDSRENANPAVRPTLTVTYTQVPEPALNGLVAVSGVALAAISRRRKWRSRSGRTSHNGGVQKKLPKFVLTP